MFWIRLIIHLDWLLWVLAYILIIKISFQDKAYGVPLVACCANLSWEFIFSFLFPQESPRAYLIIAWFVLDTVIFFQILKYGRLIVKHKLLKRLFYPIIIVTLLISFILVLYVTYLLNDWSGKYLAYSINLMVSYLFILMLVKRNNVNGQSVYIAFLKMAGTLAAFLPYLLFKFSPYLTSIGVITFIFDWVYIFLLYNKHNELGFNPWLRI